VQGGPCQSHWRSQWSALVRGDQCCGRGTCWVGTDCRETGGSDRATINASANGAAASIVIARCRWSATSVAKAGPRAGGAKRDAQCCCTARQLATWLEALRLSAPGDRMCLWFYCRMSARRARPSLAARNRARHAMLIFVRSDLPFWRGKLLNVWPAPSPTSGWASRKPGSRTYPRRLGCVHRLTTTGVDERRSAATSAYHQ